MSSNGAAEEAAAAAAAAAPVAEAGGSDKVRAFTRVGTLDAARRSMVHDGSSVVC